MRGARRIRRTIQAQQIRQGIEQAKAGVLPSDNNLTRRAYLRYSLKMIERQANKNLRNRQWLSF